MYYGQCKKRSVKNCVVNDECIYNLLPQPVEDTPKLPLYVSKYSSDVKQQAKNQRKYGHRTFGYASEPLKSPQEFLRKQSRNPKVMHKQVKQKTENGGSDAQGDKFCGISTEQYKGDLMKKRNIGVSTKKTLKNLENKEPCECITVDNKGSDKISKNKITNASADNCERSQPSKKKMLVFTRKGDKLNFSGAGMDMRFCRSSAFGKKPKYLERRRKEVEAARDEYDEKISERMKAGALRKIAPEEREDMLAGLQENHQKLNARYNRLPVMMYTAFMKNKKVQLEKQLSQLEKDMRLISAHPEIYIAR